MKATERYQRARAVTLCGALINILLGIVKLMGGYVYQSHALVADGFHSFSDLVIDSLVLFAARYSHQEADESHPYGHQRIETAATLFLSLLLILTGLGIAWHSLRDVIFERSFSPQWLALPIAALSIVANEALFRWTLHVGKKIGSQMIITNAWHHRSDAASSIVVLIGLLGGLFKFYALDAIAAIIVGCMIVKMGVEYGWEAVKALIDTAIAFEKLEKIRKTIEAVPGVKKIHQLRSRMMGSDIFIDVHILVSPKISVSEGHYIAQHVHQELKQQVTQVKDVTVHVDPEDDEIVMPSFDLPSRSQLEKNLLIDWKVKFPFIQEWMLHYLNGAVVIDLIFAEDASPSSEFYALLRDSLKQFPLITQVNFFQYYDSLLSKH